MSRVRDRDSGLSLTEEEVDTSPVSQGEDGEMLVVEGSKMCTFQAGWRG